MIAFFKPVAGAVWPKLSPAACCWAGWPKVRPLVVVVVVAVAVPKAKPVDAGCWVPKPRVWPNAGVDVAVEPSENVGAAEVVAGCWPNEKAGAAACCCTPRAGVIPAACCPPKLKLGAAAGWPVPKDNVDEAWPNAEPVLDPNPPKLGAVDVWPRPKAGWAAVVAGAPKRFPPDVPPKPAAGLAAPKSDEVGAALLWEVWPKLKPLWAAGCPKLDPRPSPVAWVVAGAPKAKNLSNTITQLKRRTSTWLKKKFTGCCLLCILSPKTEAWRGCGSKIKSHLQTRLSFKNYSTKRKVIRFREIQIVSLGTLHNLTDVVRRLAHLREVVSTPLSSRHTQMYH